MSRFFSGCSLLVRVLAVGLGVLWPWLASADSFRFAWLSDTHVGSHTAADDLRASVRDINSLTGLTFVVISGDVTEYGSREQFTLAKSILSELRIPYHIIPGNHDTKWSESGATDFPRLWKEDRFYFEHGGYVFVGLHQGPLMKMGDGHWAPQDVRWLERTLKRTKRGQPIIFITHYPIDDGIANWFVVLDLLKQYNVQAVLCGHGHANRKMSFEGVPGVMGRSNLRAKNPAGGFNLVEVKDGVMIISERTPEVELS
ncbi:MAG TPA: metallophosphoesterase, partial [Clostridia bacterium]|nr:metallophosphoesterase [Clostridia bacterium]